MKKLLSLILVAIMLVTAMPIAMAEGETYKVGDIVQFGSYPQSKVTNEAIISALNSKAPAWEDWTSYGYYSGDGSNYGSMVKGDWMRYIDVELNGEKYRGVKFTQYRPYYTCAPSSDTYQEYNGYRTNTVYWFKFEPIDWRVLDPSTGLVMCENIIDSQSYSDTIYCGYIDKDASDHYGFDLYTYFNDASHANYANDYETSSIRKWLNEDFYNTAFTDREKNEINTTTLNNDACCINGITGYEKYDSNETKDKIFLLSYNEVRNSNFGFNSSGSAYDESRQAQGSDYAKSQGLWVPTSSSHYGNSYWLLRSPSDLTDYCCGVLYNGRYSAPRVYFTDSGVRPALRFNDIESLNHSHTYDPVITPSTCTDQGYTTYTCECGDTYVDDYVDENGHTFTNYISDGKANCVVDGSLTSKCDFCDETDTKPEKGGHKFSDSYTIDEEPTCTEEGIKSRHCLYCSEIADATPIGKLAHKDDNSDYKCDYGCGYEFEKPAPDVPEEPEEELNFFEKIIQWFKDLFDKLFGWMKK